MLPRRPHLELPRVLWWNIPYTVYQHDSTYPLLRWHHDAEVVEAAKNAAKEHGCEDEANNQAKGGRAVLLASVIVATAGMRSVSRRAFFGLKKA